MSGELVSRVLELGTAHYRSQKYDKAVETFTKGIELAESYSQEELEKIRLKAGLTKRTVYPGDLVHPKYVKILDNRSASYIKLGKLNMAVKDAQKMIQAEPYNLKGYVRLTKVMALQNISDKELYKIYSRGVTKAEEGLLKYQIPIQETLRDMLLSQKMSIKERYTKRKLIPQEVIKIEPAPKRKAVEVVKRKDFMEVMPLDVVFVIFSQLSNADLRQCMLTSKTWFLVIKALPELFSKVVLKSCFPAKINGFVKFFKNYKGSFAGIAVSARRTQDELSCMKLISTIRVKELSLNMGSLTLDQVATLLTARPTNELEKLQVRVTGSRKLDNKLLELPLKALNVTMYGSGVPSNMDADPTTNPVRAVTTLEELLIMCESKRPSPLPFKNLLWCPNSLRKLVISGVSDEMLMRFRWMCHMPLLEELWIEDCKTIFTSFLAHLLTNATFTQLKKLTFRVPELGTPVPLAGTPPLDENSVFVNNVQHLISLDIMGSSLTDAALAKILAVTQSLKHLNIGHSPFIQLKTQADIVNILSSLPNLQKLHLNHSNLTDNMLDMITSMLHLVPQLDYLDLSFNVKISGYKVFELCRTFHRVHERMLGRLVLDSCTNITESTLTSLKHYVLQVDFVWEKTNWKTYGLNSYEIR